MAPTSHLHRHISSSRSAPFLQLSSSSPPRRTGGVSIFHLVHPVPATWWERLKHPNSSPPRWRVALSYPSSSVPPSVAGRERLHTTSCCAVPTVGAPHHSTRSFRLPQPGENIATVVILYLTDDRRHVYFGPRAFRPGGRTGILSGYSFHFAPSAADSDFIFISFVRPSPAGR